MNKPEKKQARRLCIYFYRRLVFSLLPREVNFFLVKKGFSTRLSNKVTQDVLKNGR
ncbi:hypothetical protein B4098_2781 [Heyndrickxia coagulans]|uniref:Uncharacterized protein n=1 Tax=Heyndrickxia coagulans TaxID=1398 RepID=A0A150K3L5_HEYCO|nr:hypothetical protein B4098_2781 [Heyndrickxia coagulans]